MTSGACRSGKACGGHSTNCAKLNRKTALSWYSPADAGWAGKSRKSASTTADATNQTADKPLISRVVQVRANAFKRCAIQSFHTRCVQSAAATLGRQIQRGDRVRDFGQRWKIPALATVASPTAHPARYRPARSDWRCESHSETRCRIQNASANPATNAGTADDSGHSIRSGQKGRPCCPVWDDCGLAVPCSRPAAATDRSAYSPP